MKLFNIVAISFILWKVAEGFDGESELLETIEEELRKLPPESLSLASHYWWSP